MLHFHKWFIFAVVILVLVTVVAPAAAQTTPSVAVSDQPIANGKVTIESVVSDGAGWIVIHTQQDGKPGPIIGYAPVNEGTNSNVVVEIDAAAATGTLYAMLHTDAGQAGVYEFPGDDVPVKAGDQVITPPFNVTDNPPAALPETGGAALPWFGLLFLAAGSLALLSGFGLIFMRRLHKA